MVERELGLIRDVPDFRDYIFESIRFVEIPKYVDLRDKFSAIENQGVLSSCTANAAVGVLEYWLITKGLKYEDLSRLYVYYNTRVYHKTQKIDSGASLRNTLKALAKYGACSEELWEYDVKKFKIKPTPECYADGKGHKIRSYSRVNSLTNVKKALADGFPVLCGIAVYDSFMNIGKDGIVNLPKEEESLKGAHAIVICGLDQERQRFICRNSWDDDWGDNGYFYLSYIYMQELGFDFWIIRK